MIWVTLSSSENTEDVFPWSYIMFILVLNYKIITKLVYKVDNTVSVFIFTILLFIKGIM